MNIYKELNECIEYIEENLNSEIDYKYISKIFGCSESTIQRVFSIITGMTLTEYIRRRRLTVSISDIKDDEKIIDIALKYGYSSGVSFSRSFKKMHGILPSKVKNSTVKLNMQPILKFNEGNVANNISYRIEDIDKFTLYGIKKEVDINNVPNTAEKLWKYMKKNYTEFNTETSYGVIKQIDGKYYYFCALEKSKDGFEKIEVPKSKYIIFKNNNNDGNKIKELFKQAFSMYIPSIGFKGNQSFELEKYSDDYMEIYVMIN